MSIRVPAKINKITLVPAKGDTDAFYRLILDVEKLPDVKQLFDAIDEGWDVTFDQIIKVTIKRNATSTDYNYSLPGTTPEPPPAEAPPEKGPTNVFDLFGPGPRLDPNRPSPTEPE